VESIGANMASYTLSNGKTGGSNRKVYDFEPVQRIRTCDEKTTGKPDYQCLAEPIASFGQIPVALAHLTEESRSVLDDRTGKEAHYGPSGRKSVGGKKGGWNSVTASTDIPVGR